MAHTDSRFDPAPLTDFVNEYQQVQPLTIGELWAVAISLRLILIENLRRISQRIIAARRGREAADKLADHVLDLGDRETIASRLFSQFEECGDFEILRGSTDPAVPRPGGVAARTSIGWRLKTDALGYSFEAVVNDEHHRQAAANVTIRNIVTSIRFISDVNWEVWFDSVSLVDQLLRTHPNYGEMDFPSRTILPPRPSRNCRAAPAMEN